MFYMIDSLKSDCINSVKPARILGIVGGAVGLIGGMGLVHGAAETWAPVNGVVPAAGFVVDRQSRAEVLYFYNSVFLASEGSETRMGWTSRYGACTPGTTHADYRKDVQRRVNFYRALAGLPAGITFDAEPALNSSLAGTPQVGASVTKRTCAQAAAYNNAFSEVFLDDFALTHTPTDANTFCNSPPAWNGAYNSNLTIGYYGPRAVDVYIADDNLLDDRSNNSNVGHRRWVLYSRATDMSTGDVPPGTFDYLGTTFRVLPANALYIAGSLVPEPAAPKQFVTWPPAGYVPVGLKPLRWSISFPDAGFPTTAAAITLTGPGGALVPVTILSANAPKTGDNTLVFQPAQTTITGQNDAAFTVTVNGMTGPGVPASHTWRSTFFDPSLVGIPQPLMGPVRPSAAGAVFQATPIPHASAYELLVNANPPAASPYLENGDGPAPDIKTDKTGVYPVLQGAESFGGRTFTPRTGAKSLHLCFPLDESEIDSLPHNQSFALGPEFIPSASSTVSFYELFRWVFQQNRLSLEISNDGGGSWAELYGRNGAYTFVTSGSYTSTGWDAAWAQRSVSLGAYAGQPVRLRFILRHNDLSFDGADINHGCYVDDINLTGVRRLTTGVSTAFPSPAVRLDSSSAGSPLAVGTSYFLRTRARLGGRWMGYSPLFSVTAKPPTGYEAAFPALAAAPLGDADGDGICNFIEYAFALNATAPNSSANLPQPVGGSGKLTLDFAIPTGINDLNYSAEFSTNFSSWLPVTNSGTGNRRTFAMPVVPGEKCFMRLKVVQQGGAVVGQGQ